MLIVSFMSLRSSNVDHCDHPMLRNLEITSILITIVEYHHLEHDINYFLSLQTHGVAEYIAQVRFFTALSYSSSCG